MKKSNWIYSLAAALLFLPQWIIIPQAARAIDGTTVEIGSAVTRTGGVVEVPITVKNVTSPAGLGGYDLQVRYDPLSLRINRISQGNHPYFGAPIQNVNNLEGVAYINGFHARIPGPTGDINLAVFEFTALKSGEWELTPGIVTLVDTQGSDIPASPASGRIKVDPGPAVEAASSFLQVNMAASLPVILRDMPGNTSPAGYRFKVSFSSPEVKITGIRGGDGPYNSTPDFKIDTGTASVTIAAASPPSPVPGGVVTVANIEVLAEKAGKYTADVSVEKLEGAGGVPIVPKVIQGQVWVFPPATIEGPATSITEGEYAAVPIQLKNVSSILGLGAYELELNYDPKAIKVHRVTDWPMPDKSYVQASSEISDGLITASGTINRKPGPVGNVSLLELIIQGLQAGRYPIDITVKRLTDTDDRPIEAAPSPAIVTISPFTTVVIGSVSLQVGKAGRVPVAIRNYADQAGLGSANLEIGYPRQMMEFISVEKGDVDLADISQVQPPEQDNAIGRILFSTAPAAGLGSRDEIVLAYIKLMPLAEGEITLTLRAGRLLNSAGQPQAARGIQGVITAGSPFKISQLAVSPRYPVIKDSFKITAVISNAGNAAAVYPVRLWIDGVMEKSGSVELGAGETKNMSFDVTREKPGMFKANFGGKDFLFNVVDPADLTLAALKVNTGRPGGTTAVSATVENNGDVEALYLAVLKLNRAEFDSKEVALKPGEKREIVFPLANLPSGSYSVDLNGLSDSFSVTGSSGQIFSLTMFLGIFAALEAVFIIILIYKSGWWKKKEATG